MIRNKQEIQLVGKMLVGDRRAFEGFYRRHKVALKRFVVARVNNQKDVEELVQDTFLGFLDSLPLFAFRSTLKTFLYSIARHEVADYWRRRYAKKALKYVPIVGELVDERLYSTAELSRRIDKIYQSLRPDSVTILQWKYEEGMSVKEIAGKLKTSIKAAESRLFRARREFQLAYGEL